MEEGDVLVAALADEYEAYPSTRGGGFVNRYGPVVGRTFKRSRRCVIRVLPADGHQAGDIEIIADAVKEETRAGTKVCTFTRNGELVGRFDRVDSWRIGDGDRGHGHG